MNFLDSFLLSLNAVICALIVLRLITFERQAFEYGHNWFFSIVAYLFILSNAALVIRVLTGDLTYVDWTSVTNNFFLCIALLLFKGNIRPFLKKDYAPKPKSKAEKDSAPE